MTKYKTLKKIQDWRIKDCAGCRHWEPADATHLCIQGYCHLYKDVRPKGRYGWCKDYYQEEE